MAAPRAGNVAPVRGGDTALRVPALVRLRVLPHVPVAGVGPKVLRPSPKGRRVANPFPLSLGLARPHGGRPVVERVAPGPSGAAGLTTTRRPRGVRPP